jgi:hypothetical protein
MMNEKTRALAEQIETSINTLATETDAVRKSQNFLNWLDAMAKFSSYSLNNQILILLQRPLASRVAGFQTWRKLGRHVVKGAKGIAILAPCTYGKKTDTEEDDSPTIKRLGGFKVVWVFAEEDTDGEPLPTLTYAAATGGEELLPQLEAAARTLAIQLDYEEIPEAGVQGYSAGGRIVIRKSLETPAKAAVILHELSHELLHRGDARKTVSRRQRELEAEATAYVVMHHFGIDHIASNYLATYDVDGEQLRESLGTISKGAKRLIAVIEGNQQDLQHTEKEGLTQQRGGGRMSGLQHPGIVTRVS